MVQSDEEFPTTRDTAVRAVVEAGMAAVPWYVEVIAAPMRVIMEDTQRRRAARLEMSMVEVADGVRGLDALAVALTDTENDVQFVQAMEAAVRSGDEAKRRLLVKAVVNSINDDARFDESQMTIDALAELNTMHVRALALLDEELNEEGKWKVPLRSAPEGSADVYVAEDLLRAAGRSAAWEALPPPVKATLIRSGTCHSTSGMGTFAPSHADRPLDGINGFGRILLQELRAEAKGSSR